MARKVDWRQDCPPGLSEVLQTVSQSRLLVLQQLGPTGFVLKAPSHPQKFRVSIGDLNSCSCKRGHRENCVHILFVLTRVYRLPPDNPLVWQRSLLSSEVDSLVSGRAMSFGRKGGIKESGGVVDAQIVPPRRHSDTDEGDVCPICYDRLGGGSTSSSLLVYCRFGCGNGIHAYCFAQYASHHSRSQGRGSEGGSSPLLCPLCRAKWGPVGERAIHRVRCSSCAGPVNGELYSCAFCHHYALCSICFSTTRIHAQHPFNVCHSPGAPVVPAHRPVLPSSVVPQELMTDSAMLLVSDGNGGLLSRWRALREGIHVPDITIPSFTTPNQGAEDDAGVLLGASTTHGLQRVPSMMLREIGPDDYDQLVALDENNARHVMTASDFAKLRVVTWGDQATSSSEAVAMTMCLICHEEFSQGSRCVVLPECMHTFHVDCAHQWLTVYSSSCPVDHQRVQPRSGSMVASEKRDDGGSGCWGNPVSGNDCEDGDCVSPVQTESPPVESETRFHFSALERMPSYIHDDGPSAIVGRLHPSRNFSTLRVQQPPENPSFALTSPTREIQPTLEALRAMPIQLSGSSMLEQRTRAVETHTDATLRLPHAPSTPFQPSTVRRLNPRLQSRRQSRVSGGRLRALRPVLGGDLLPQGPSAGSAWRSGVSEDAGGNVHRARSQSTNPPPVVITGTSSTGLRVSALPLRLAPLPR